jgi:UPF0716 family protein affecting phage T7 exclusion
MWVLFAILVAGDMFGIPGMILGVPVFACIYAFIAVWLRDSLRAKNLSSKTEDYFRLTGFDEKTGTPMYRSKHEERITARQRKKKKHKHFLMMQKLQQEAEKKAAEDDDAEESAKADDAENK